MVIHSISTSSLPSPRRQYIIVIILATILRLGIFAFSSTIPYTLERRPELTTPLTGFRSLREGVFIFERGTNPYDGGVFHHSPLYLLLFTYALPLSSNMVTALSWTLADVAAAVALVRIWRTRILPSGVSPEDEERDALVSALYLFNPYTLMSCLARTTTSLDNFVLLLAIHSANSGQAVAACSLLAVAAHTSLYPVLLLPPVLMLLAASPPTSHSWLRPFHLVLGFITAFAALALLNGLLVGSAWIAQTWGVILTVSDLTPNVGMWWYFFTEMFDHFRSFFLGVFHLHNVIYVTPVCLRWRDDPLLATLILMAVFGTWKSYPTLGDAAVWAGLLGCFPDIVQNLRHPLFTLTVHLYTSILLPLLHSLWLLTGTGNANFFYAATMVFGLNASLAIVDVMGAGFRTVVKRKVAEEMSHEAVQPNGRWPRKKVEEQWMDKGWAVVQLTKLEE